MVKKGEVTKVKNQAIMSPLNFEGDGGAGMENLDKDSVAIPFIKVLQKMSPVCDEDNELYVKGAKPGLFYNTVTEEMSDRIVVIPCHYERIFNEWIDRDAGGGFKGSHTAAEVELMSTERDDKGRFWLNETNYLMDTRNHYILVVDVEKNTVERAIFSMSSTHIKVSKNWLSKISRIKLAGSNGPFTPPSFAHMWEMTTIGQTKGNETWKLAQLNLLSVLGEGDEDIYAQAKDFYELVRAGKVKVSEPTDDSKAGKDFAIGDEDF
jgi:hypothetical protein